MSIADPFYLGLSMFADGPIPPCQAAADHDGDGHLDISDCVFLMNHLFEPVPSRPLLGECEVASSDLPCDTAPACRESVPPIPGKFTVFLAGSPLAGEPPAGAVLFVDRPGRQVEIPFFVFLKGETEEGVGASGWSLGIAIEDDSAGTAFSSVTFEDTAVEPIFEDGEEGALSFRTAKRTSDLSGYYSAVALDLLSPLSLVGSPQGPAHLVLRGTVWTTIPHGGSRAFTLRPLGGLPAGNGPVALEVAAGNRAFIPEALPLRVELQHGDPFEFFLRGDSNQDGRHDISDPIFTLERLFLGGPPGECPDASDANDDGAVDISDGISSLGCLFLGTACPAPSPECGRDFTEDDLPCDILGLNCR